MNKQKNRKTPFNGKYKMGVDEFAEKYGLDLKVIMRRMNCLFWDDFDAIVVPTELGDTSPDKIRRALKLVDNDWNDNDIETHLQMKRGTMQTIHQLSPYMKKVFEEMDNFFFLNPANVDLDKVFVERG